MILYSKFKSHFESDTQKHYKKPRLMITRAIFKSCAAF